ncbi:hypothetical protein N9B39_01905 [bacterium]|nr:hypothetical protein [bacterium]MDB4533052.1 hypothetical protein [bacterium]
MSAASVSAYLDCSLVEAVDVLKLAVLEGQGKIVASSGGSMVVEKFDDAKAAETKAAINASVKIECDRIKAEARWH